MKKHGRMLVILAVLLSFSSISFAAPLPDGTMLSFFLGNGEGGGQKPTTVDLQILTKFTAMNDGCIVEASASTITVTDGTVLGFNCKVGNGPDPCYGELNGVPLTVDSIGLIICEPSVTGTDTYKLVFHNKCNGGKDTDRMTIKIVK